MRREKKAGGLILAFAIPVVLMVIIFIARGIFPFGEQSFLRTDMYHQYAPFFSEFQYKLRTGGSLLYSWDIGMGVNFSAIYAYYLASPFNWLLILVPKAFVLEFMTYLIVVKTGLAGLSMAWYLEKHCGTDSPSVALFGIFYAMSGYMAAYSWNIMWLDCIVLFPLIILALEYLVHRGRFLPYTLLLGLCILSNYYISIMICIFMVIYFIALLILEKGMNAEKLGKRALAFTGGSLLAGALAAVTLLPEYFALQATASADSAFPHSFTEYFSVFDMIARHLPNVQPEEGLEHWPNIYCGVAVLMFFVLYLLCRQISVREKAVYSSLLLILLASFALNIPNFIWHGFHYPNSLPCRQSFIYIFLVLLLCFEACTHLKEFPKRQIFYVFWGVVAYIFMAQKLITQEHFHFIVYYVAIVFLALYLGIIFLYRSGERYRFLALGAAFMLVSAEAGINMAVTSVTTTSRTAYVKDNEDVRRLVSEARNMTDDFFRMSKVKIRSKDDGAWMNYPSVSLFSSTASADMSALFKKLGCESSTNAYGAEGLTPLTKALFSVRFGLYSEQPKADGFIDYTAQDGTTWMYENRYCLPLGFMVDNGFEMRVDLETGNPADVQNSLAYAVGADPFFTYTDSVWEDDADLILTAPEDGLYYAYVTNHRATDVTVMTADSTTVYENVDRGYLLSLGFSREGDEVTLSAKDETMRANIYRASASSLQQVCDALGASPWELSYWDDTTLTGTVDAGNGGVLFTSIPYDKGWTITVDGSELPGVEILGAFLSVSLPAGVHTVEMRYFPQGLRAGSVISGIALLIVILCGAGIIIWRKRRRDNWDEDFEYIEFDEEPEDEFYGYNKEEISGYNNIKEPPDSTDTGISDHNRDTRDDDTDNNIEEISGHNDYNIEEDSPAVTEDGGDDIS